MLRIVAHAGLRLPAARLAKPAMGSALASAMANAVMSLPTRNMDWDEDVEDDEEQDAVEHDDLWCTVDPFDLAQGQPGSVWWSSSIGLYYSGGYPIYFVGRNYRYELGRAPASDEAAVGDPLEQWEENLRRFAPEEYLAYRREIARHLWF